MKKIIFPTAALLFALSASAQSQHLTGSVKDTSDNIKIPNVVVSVLTAKDSFLYSFAKTDKDGRFQIPVPPSEPYFLLYEASNYADFVSTVYEPKSNVAPLNVILISKSKLMSEIIVKSRQKPMTLKGDTIEYAADSFKVQPNATVEELLKRMPGIQIDTKGNITAQGRTVQKVLVDGEEFFGDDPKLVTQNLRAEVVDKVQVYDKQSDQAAFTGVNDGKDKTTINLKIKEGAKKGSFGKVQIGAGTKGYHQSELNYNLFRNKEKFSIIGEVANNAKAGLRWTDRQFGFNDDNNSDDGADIGTNQNNTSKTITWDGNYANQGIPLSQFGGLHYNNTSASGRASVEGDYKINRLHINGNTESDVVTNLPTGTQSAITKTNMSDISFRNKLDGKSTFYLDSAQTTSLIINAHGELNHKNSSRTITGATTSDGALLNDTKRSLSNIGDNNGQHLDVLFRKKLKKERRTFSLFVSEESVLDKGTGVLNATQNFYLLDSIGVTNQHKDYNTNNFILQTKATYTEPLGKNGSLVANYGVIINNSHSINNSFNQDASGNYSVLDSTYSNKYAFNQLMHRAGLFYAFKNKNSQINIGTNVGFNSFTQENKYDGTSFKRNFVNWYPHVRYKMTASHNRSYELNYSGTTTQPTVGQIQPLLNNQDPLNVYIGNQSLNPTFTNTLNLRFNKFDVLEQFGIFTGITATNSSHAITTNTTTNTTTGKTTYQYVNADGNGSLTGYYYLYKKKGDLSLNTGVSGSLVRYKNFVNSLLNVTNAKTIAWNNTLTLDKDKKYTFELYSQLGYQWNQASLQKAYSNNYFNMNVKPDALLYLPGNMKLDVSYDYYYQGKSKTYNTTNVYGLLNAYVGKTFFKNEALELRVTGFDLLNKNQNFNRNYSGNQFYQNFSNVVRRYVLFSVIWNFHTGMASGMKNNDDL